MGFAAKLRALPDDFMLYCGHEYTASNVKFALTIDPDNAALKARAEEVTRLRAESKPTIPLLLGDEKRANVFLRADAPAIAAEAADEGRERRRGVRRIARAQEQVLMALPMPTAAEIIERLDLKPHPEGGHYRETFRDQRPTPRRGRVRRRSISCWRAASVRTGIASMRSRSGTTMPARR